MVNESYHHKIGRDMCAFETCSFNIEIPIQTKAVTETLASIHGQTFLVHKQSLDLEEVHNWLLLVDFVSKPSRPSS